jgi:polygalacturonase
MSSKIHFYMTAKIAITILLTFGFSCWGCTTSGNYHSVSAEKIRFERIEFDMPAIQEPSIPDFEVNIKDFGAVEGGQVLNSKAFADAIEAVSQKGGGKVVIPAGIWLTGPVILKSHLELHTDPGALVVFSDDKDLYPVIETSFEGLDTWRCISPVYGKNVEDIAFTGHGVWDGSGDAWRFVKKSKLTANQWKELVASGGVLNEKGDEWYPSEQFKKAQKTANMNVPEGLSAKEDYEGIRDFLRPVMVSIQNSRRVLFDGPTFQNSPAWCIHPLMVEDLIVRNLTIRNPWYSQNGDGIDIESCKNVLVENCNFDVGDDAICIKSGKDEDGRRRGIPSENLVIRNNIVYHGHGGVTVGSEMSGGVRNMHVSNCIFMGTDVGLRFKSTRGRGGVVENIFISAIRMTNIPTNAISFNLYYGGMSVSEMLASGKSDAFAEAEPVTEETPQFKNIFMKDIVVKGALQSMALQGLPEMNLENVTMTDMLFEAENGFSIIDADNVKIENVELMTRNSTGIELYNSKNVVIKNLKYRFEAPNSITVNGSESSNIKILPVNDIPLKGYTAIGEEVANGAVVF